MFIRFGSLTHRILEDAYNLHLWGTPSFMEVDTASDDEKGSLNVHDLENKYSSIEVSEDESDVRSIVESLVDLGVLKWKSGDEFSFSKDYGYNSDPADIHLIGGLFDVIREAVASHDRLTLDGRMIGVPERFLFEGGKPSRAEGNALDLLLKFENLLESIVTFANGESGMFYCFKEDK